MVDFDFAERISMNERVWTVSNVLSIVRLLLVVPIAVLLLRNDSPRFLLAGLIVVAGMTDLFDGMLARRFNQVTELGKIIDPLADKIGIAAVAIILTLQGRIPTWFMLFVVVRDVAIFIGGLYLKSTRGIVLQSNLLGKWAVACIAVLILVVALETPQLEWMKTVLLGFATLLLAASSVSYGLRFASVLHTENVSPSSS
jgi:CDP-diacylglycerol--glycerol-3-phosphate 3-phosphatidyltransferase